MPVTSISRQRRRDATRSCGSVVVGLATVAVEGRAEGDDASLRWWVRDVSSFQRCGTLTPGLTNPGERVSSMTDPPAISLVRLIPFSDPAP